MEISRPFSGPGFHPPLAGVLVNITKVNVAGEDRICYTLKLKGGKTINFLAIHDLEDLVRPEHIGQWMVIKLDAFAWPSRRFSVWLSSEKRWIPAG